MLQHGLSYGTRGCRYPALRWGTLRSPSHPPSHAPPSHAPPSHAPLSHAPLSHAALSFAPLRRLPTGRFADPRSCPKRLSGVHFRIELSCSNPGSTPTRNTTHAPTCCRAPTFPCRCRRVAVVLSVIEPRASRPASGSSQVPVTSIGAFSAMFSSASCSERNHSPGVGNTPSCCINPHWSQFVQASWILPSAIVKTVVIVQLTCLPVAGMPKISS